METISTNKILIRSTHSYDAGLSSSNDYNKAIIRATTTSYPKKCRKDYSFMNHFEAVTIVSKQYKPIANASSGTPQSFM